MVYYNCPLTHNGEDDHHEVEDVPAVGEVVVAQGDELDDALGGEDDDEGQVDVVEDVLDARRLFVRLHHHRHHVEYDQQHYQDVEGLLGHQVEEESLDRVLRRKSVRIHQNHWYVTLEHGRSHTQHQQYSVWVKIIHFSVMTKIIRILRSCSMKIFSKFTTLNISKLNFWLLICIAKTSFEQL